MAVTIQQTDGDLDVVYLKKTFSVSILNVMRSKANTVLHEWIPHTARIFVVATWNHTTKKGEFYALSLDPQESIKENMKATYPRLNEKPSGVRFIFSFY